MFLCKKLYLWLWLLTLTWPSRVEPGGSDYAAACQYIADKFLLWPGQTRRPDTFICATDTAQVKALIGSIVGTL